MTIGIVGAGQLGRMLALAGYPLGARLPVPGSGGACRRPRKLAPHLHGAFTIAGCCAELARRSEVVTFDWENVSVRGVARAQGARAHLPAACGARGIAQDRVSEKRLFERLRIPTTRWRAVGLARAA